ncbi:MAG: 1-acyl-sn-glycerol-3-phosphate acyltransferase [Bacteroidetes bacterium]|nr:1-acyl-sn-glycerol-3-phosphate acyltransferase [Bacteroidota bacterium]
MRTFRALLNLLILPGYVIPVLIWFYLMIHSRRSYRFEIALKRHCRILFRLLGVRVIVKGNLQPLYRQKVIIMPNHISYLDLPLLFGFLKVPMCGLEDHRHFRYPLYGKIIRRIGNLPVDRRNPVQSFKSAEQLRIHSESKQVVIYPEAGRSRDGHLMELKRMPFQVAKEFGRPILPVFVYGMADVNTKQSPLIYPGEIVIFIRPVVPREVVMRSNLDDLRSQVAAELSFAPFTKKPTRS